MVEVEQGVPAEAGVDGVNETIDGVINAAIFSRCRKGPGREMAEEQRRIDYIFIDLRGRNLGALNCGLSRYTVRLASQGGTLVNVAHKRAGHTSELATRFLTKNQRIETVISPPKVDG